MNASPLVSSRTSSDAPAPSPAPSRRRSVRSLLGTITGICFVFGALLAVQLRSISNLQAQREDRAKSDVQQKQIALKNRVAAERAARERETANKNLVSTINTLKAKGDLSSAQIKALSGQIKNLQVQACLTPMTGEGVRIVLSDNPQAAQAGGNPSMPLPGLVHDYDVLQVVNELRAAKADAIAVRGAGGKTIRITGTTPIRCVGPVIFINWNPVAAPFTIEAVGDPKTLRSALEMPGGIVENMRTQGAVGVKVSVDKLEVPPADALPGTPTTDVVAAPAPPSGKAKGA